MVISSQFKKEIERDLIIKKIPFFKGPSILSFIEFTYAGCVYKTSEILPFIDPLIWFGKYRDLQEKGCEKRIEEVCSLLEDDQSKKIIKNRFDFL